VGGGVLHFFAGDVGLGALGVEFDRLITRRRKSLGIFVSLSLLRINLNTGRRGVSCLLVWFNRKNPDLKAKSSD
jgi:hypothetical protein